VGGEGGAEESGWRCCAATGWVVRHGARSAWRSCIAFVAVAEGRHPLRRHIGCGEQGSLWWGRIAAAKASCNMQVRSLLPLSGLLPPLCAYLLSLSAPLSGQYEHNQVHTVAGFFAL
jgi:hypothetical protein